MIAEVAFDLPRRRAFAYRVPEGLRLAPGQRVSAPLQGRARVGLVLAVTDGDTTGLKVVQRVLDPVPLLGAAGLALGRWAAEESLSSWGSTLLALLPPPAREAGAPVAPPAEPRPATPVTPELWTAADRDARLEAALGQHPGAALLVAPDTEGAARWARRLDAARLDSAVPQAERRAAWFAAARGRARVVVGTRSALLAPLPPPALVALLDEHDPAHRPPGPPRIHSRELLRRRAELEGSRLLLLSPSPSVESWWRAEQGHCLRPAAGPGPWPEIVTADTRGILRRHPLTLPLTRALEHALRAGRRAALLVTRRAAALACDECGALLRCPACGVALALARPPTRLDCRLCARSEPLPERCPGCRGHRLSPFGWDAERVAAAVAKRFPRARVGRGRAEGQIAIGTPALLRTLGPRSVGLVGFVALDGLLRVPDFRAGERAFQLLWAASEAVGPDGRVLVQTLHPEHYAVEAARAQDLAGFYARELEARAELGYPPFRRLALVSVRGRSDAQARAVIGECARALDGAAGMTAYPPAPAGAPGGRSSRWRMLVKGPEGLPWLLAAALGPFLERPRGPGGMVEVEMDPES